jgi:hypothetical protein
MSQIFIYVESCDRCGCPYLRDSTGDVRPAPMLPAQCGNRSCPCHR